MQLTKKQTQKLANLLNQITNKCIHEDKSPHFISWSQLQNWLECPYKHYLISIDKSVPYETNEYSAHGRAIHTCLEAYLRLFHQNPITFDLDTIFELYIQTLTEEANKIEDPDFNKLLQITQNTKHILKSIKLLLDSLLSCSTIYSIEEPISEEIGWFSTDEKYFIFKGYIDLVLKQGDRYILMDWKTSTSGWSGYKRTDKNTIYQSVLYAIFWSQKHNIDISKIEFSYALLNHSTLEVDVFKPTIDQKIIDECKSDVHKMLWNCFEKRRYLKSPLCNFCICEEKGNK